MIPFFVITLFLNLANAYTIFPAGQCRPQDCSTNNPYILQPNSSTDKLCFTVYQQSCDDNNGCCNSLKNLFEKIAFKTYPECYRSIEKVTIDGVKKGGGVYITNYTGFAELKVTAIRSNINNILNKTFCVHLRPPCESLTKFCRGPSCTYSVYDPFTHTCCPTCDFIFPTDTLASKPEFPPVSLPPDDYYYPPVSSLNTPPVLPDAPTVTPLSPPPVLPNTPTVTPLSPPVLPNTPTVTPLSPPVLPNTPTVTPLSPPVLPNIPPTSPNKPEVQITKIKLLIKAPTLDQYIVLQHLCPNLEAMFDTPCKIIYISTTGIYYGHYLLYEFTDVLEMIQNDIDTFTKSNGLLCDSTIALSNDDRVVRYSASKNTCN